jgi:hypothetical protein
MPLYALRPVAAERVSSKEAQRVRRLSETVTDGKLNRTRGRGRYGTIEECGTGDTNIGVVIRMVEHIEGVDAEIDVIGGSVAVEKPGEAKELRVTEIELS